MNIVVYLGSSEGSDKLKKAVKELGSWIAESGHKLVYGGSDSGLMGDVADAVLEKGGKVIGVEPEFFIESDFQHKGITQLVLTKTMAERRTKMIEIGDAFIAFPGGIGTLDEISEAMVLRSLGRLDAPCIIYNLDGYYDNLLAFFETMIKEGLAAEKSIGKTAVVRSLDEIKEILK